MNLQELINTPPKIKTNCKFGPWLESLTETEKTTIKTAFQNSEITTTHLARALQEFGCPSSASTIRTHRRNECHTCERTTKNA